ncbi:hypothetical protein D3C77_618140 [compost metagenome]
MFTQVLGSRQSRRDALLSVRALSHDTEESESDAWQAELLMVSSKGRVLPAHSHVKSCAHMGKLGAVRDKWPAAITVPAVVIADGNLYDLHTAQIFKRCGGLGQ